MEIKISLFIIIRKWFRKRLEVKINEWELKIKRRYKIRKKIAIYELLIRL